MTVEISLVDAPRCMLGEGPLWDGAAQALYYLDVVGQKIHCYEPGPGLTRSWTLPEPPRAMALSQSGALVLATKDAIHALDPDTGALERIAGPRWASDRTQFNDGKVDRRGRFIVGAGDSAIRDPEPIGGIYSLGPDRSLTEIDTGIRFSNGPCWSPDDKTFYFSESLGASTFAYDYDIDTGRLSNKRLFADTRPLGGVPDGTTVDRDGLVWMAICQGAKIVAWRPDGTLERQIPLPVALPTSVMFGGPRLDVLYVTSIDPAALGGPPEAGAGGLYRIEGLGACGVPEPRYAG
jgi:sugar lactone lactonase YvrE